MPLNTPMRVASSFAPGWLTRFLTVELLQVIVAITLQRLGSGSKLLIQVSESPQKIRAAFSKSSSRWMQGHVVTRQNEGLDWDSPFPVDSPRLSAGWSSSRANLEKGRPLRCGCR